MTHKNSAVIDQQNLLTRYNNQPRQVRRFNRLHRPRIKDQALFPDILLCGQIAHRRWPGPSPLSLSPCFTHIRNCTRSSHFFQWCFVGEDSVQGDKGRRMSQWCNVFRWKKMDWLSADWGSFDKLWWSYANEGCGRIAGLHDSISSSQTNTLPGWAMNLSAGTYTDSIICMIMKLK